MSSLYRLIDAQLSGLKPFFPRAVAGLESLIEATYLLAHRTASILCMKNGRADAR